VDWDELEAELRCGDEIFSSGTAANKKKDPDFVPDVIELSSEDSDILELNIDAAAAKKTSKPHGGKLKGTTTTIKKVSSADNSVVSEIKGETLFPISLTID